MTAGQSKPHLEAEDPGPSWAQIWDTVEMQKNLDSGICEEISTEERLGIHPFWLKDIQMGAMETLKTELGKWSKVHKGYLLGFKRPIQLAGLGKQSGYPNPLIYFNFKLTRYIYRPSEGQCLKGIISRLGQKAASCVVFGTFMATVYPKDEAEQGNWELEDELEFTVQSFDQLRKGVSLRGKSTGVIKKSTGNLQNKRITFGDDNSQEIGQSLNVQNDSVLDQDECPSPKKSKKKKKTKDLADETMEIAPDPVQDSLLILDDSEIEKPKKKKKKRHRDEIGEYLENNSVDIVANDSVLSEPVKKKRKKNKE